MQIPFICVAIFNQLVQLLILNCVKSVTKFKPASLDEWNKDCFYEFSICIIYKEFCFIIYFFIGSNIDPLVTGIKIPYRRKKSRKFDVGQIPFITPLSPGIGPEKIEYFFFMYILNLNFFVILPFNREYTFSCIIKNIN